MMSDFDDIGFGWDDVTSGWQTVHEAVMPYASQVPVVKEFVPLADLAYHAATGKPTQGDIAAKKKADAAKAATTAAAKTSVAPTGTPVSSPVAVAAKTSNVVLWVLGIGTVATIGVLLLRRR